MGAFSISSSSNVRMMSRSNRDANSSYRNLARFSYFGIERLADRHRDFSFRCCSERRIAGTRVTLHTLQRTVVAWTVLLYIRVSF